MKRRLGNWLDAYIDYTQHSEPPRSYHMWIGISVIAAAMQRKCYINWHVGRMHPNLFVVLVGPSGRCRKGTAMSFGQDLIRQITGVRLIAQKTTEQQLIRDLKDSLQDFHNPSSGVVEMHCSMTVMSGELAVFLGSGNVEYLALLTNLYDSEEEWEYRTKHQGKDKIKGVCLNFLGGTAPDWLSTMVPSAAIGGGFTSRIIFVVERDKAKLTPDPTPTPRMLQLREDLIADLEKIYNLAGEMRQSERAVEWYENWYMELAETAPIADAPNFDGYMARRATHIKKLGMIMSAARGGDLTIRVEDYERALAVLEAAEETMPQAFTGLGKAKYSAVSEDVLNLIIARGGKLKHSEILRTLHPDIDQYTLKIVMETLLAMQSVTVANVNMKTGDKTYKLVE